MAGLAAAAEARSLGAEVLLMEKLDRPGGSMLLSSGVVWRHRAFERFRDDCPGGDPLLQRTVFERLDADLAWLESLGAPIVSRATGNELTSGARFEPTGMCQALVEAAGPIRLSEPLRELPDATPVVLATGGFPANRELLRRHVTQEADSLLLRTAPGATGDGLRLGLEAGAEVSAGLDEFYGRNMPAPPARIGEPDFVPLAQLYARHATVRNRDGDTFETHTWSENDVVQWTARQPGARAWYAVSKDALRERVRERSVEQMVSAAEAAGAPVERRGGVVEVEVA